MSAVPTAVPLAWSWRMVFVLEKLTFWRGNGSDCLRHRRLIR
jgi:hypothetical protein